MSHFSVRHLTSVAKLLLGKMWSKSFVSVQNWLPWFVKEDSLTKERTSFCYISMCQITYVPSLCSVIMWKQTDLTTSCEDITQPSPPWGQAGVGAGTAADSQRHHSEEAGSKARRLHQEEPPSLLCPPGALHDAEECRCWRHLTCADQGTVVVQGPQVGPRQWQEGVEFVEVIPEPRPREDWSNDDVAERMADEATERWEGSMWVSAGQQQPRRRCARSTRGEPASSSLRI